jgi:transcriptional regulator with XRE-family HTH domain
MLRSARESLGLTQKQVGALLTGQPEGGVIHKYEKGTQTPDLDRLAELIAVLRLDDEAVFRAYLRAKIAPEAQETLAERPESWLARG